MAVGGRRFVVVFAPLLLDRELVHGQDGGVEFVDGAEVGVLGGLGEGQFGGGLGRASACRRRSLFASTRAVRSCWRMTCSRTSGGSSGSSLLTARPQELPLVLDGEPPGQLGFRAFFERLAAA